jgi:hypothetical protein
VRSSPATRPLILAGRDPATMEADLYRARVLAAQALLARAGRARKRGDLAGARRDLQAAIDKQVDMESGEAAHALAEMIDDARGNPREDRFPPVDYSEETHARERELRKVTSSAARARRPAKAASDRRQNLRALGHATESDAIEDAIALCYTAIRLAGTPVWSRGASALLAQLLDDCGDAGGAAAARAHLDIPGRLIELSFEAGESSYVDHSARDFAPYLVARLRPAEMVEKLERSFARRPQHADLGWLGYVILTNERLLFLDHFGDFERRWPSSIRPLPEYELVAVDRAGILSVRPTEYVPGETRLKVGRTWLEIRLPVSADGRAIHDGVVNLSVRGAPDRWLTALSPSG